jgi:hypothetical protein
MGRLTEFYESFTLYYTKMSFKILKFSVRPSDFFPSNLLYYYYYVMDWHVQQATKNENGLVSVDKD